MVERPIKRSERSESSAGSSESKPKPILRTERGENHQEQGEDRRERVEDRQERGEDRRDWGEDRRDRGGRGERGERGERGKGRGKGRGDREEKVAAVPMALLRGPKPQPKVETPEVTEEPLEESQAEPEEDATGEVAPTGEATDGTSNEG